LNQPDDLTDRELKAGVDIESVFRGALTRLIALKFGIDPGLIWSYQLSELDENSRNDLKVKVRSAMDSPRETGTYQLGMQANLNPDEARALRFVEIEGLLVLGMLGDKSIIPLLLERLKRESGNAQG
jgi:hypothetical protein